MLLLREYNVFSRAPKNPGFLLVERAGKESPGLAESERASKLASCDPARGRSKKLASFYTIASNAYACKRKRTRGKQTDRQTDRQTAY